MDKYNNDKEIDLKKLEEIGIPYILISDIDYINHTADCKFVDGKNPDRNFECKARISTTSKEETYMSFYKILDIMMNCCKGSKKFRRKAWDDHEFYKNAYICFEMDRFNDAMVMIHYNTNKANPGFLYNPIPKDLVANDWEEYK